MGKRNRNQSHRYGDTVEIIMGSDRKCFNVHKSILTEQSKFFRDYFRNSHSRQADDSIILQGYDSAAFTHVVDFMYNSPSPIIDNDEIPTILDTYALASELDFETCMNNCVDRLRAFARDNLLYPDNLLYLERTNLEQSSEVHKFMVDQFAYQLVSQPDSGLIKRKDRLTEWMRDLFREASRRMLEEVMQRQLVYAKRFRQGDFSWNALRANDPSGMYGCRYHVHEYTDCHLVSNDRQLVRYRPQ